MDILAYIPDLLAFRIEAQAAAKNGVLGFTFDDENNVSYNIAKVPVVYKNLESVCLVRLTTQAEVDVFNSLSSCEKIGTCEKVNDENQYIFINDGKAKYDVVYDQSTQFIDDGQGNQIEYTPPTMIGVFA